MQEPVLEKTELIAPKKVTAMRKRQDAPTKDSKQKELKNIEDSLNDLHDTILKYASSLLLAMVLSGRRLLAAKKLQSHGQYTNWIEETFKGRISIRTAQRYTNLATFAETNMLRLRNVLKEIVGDDVVDMSDDEVLAELPASKVFELIAYDKQATVNRAKLTSSNQTLDVRFVTAITEFLGTADLVLTSTPLGDGEIETQKTVTAKDPAKVVGNDWPNTVVAILTNRSSATTSEAICAAFEATQVREALLLIPADQLESSSLIERPQLHFKACHPFAATKGKLVEIPMTLLLISDDDRVADFAKAFGSLGIVKVPFVPTPKKN
jgi:hypothetical protein